MIPDARQWPAVLAATLLAVMMNSSASMGQDAANLSGYAPLVWAECEPEAVEVMVLGTFHFAQSTERLDIYDPKRQQELSRVLDRLEGFAPDRIAVEYPYSQAADLDGEYAAYLERPAESLGSRNEIRQIGFRLARRLGHTRVSAVDVPMNLWHDSITTFDERWPDARQELRARWPQRYLDPDPAPSGDRPLGEILAGLNRDAPPANAEMYANFLPLVREDLYVGALKLRPWYDRNLRIVQNVFRSLEPEDDRLLLIIGAGHMRILKQILELTPQLCPVNPVSYLP